MKQEKTVGSRATMFVVVMTPCGRPIGGRPAATEPSVVTDAGSSPR